MNLDKLQDILEELYQSYPDLKKYESELKDLMLEMVNNKPEVKIDEFFVSNLKKKLLTSLSLNKKKNNKFNFNIMNKRIFIAAGSLVAISILLIAAISIYGPESKKDSVWNIASLINNKNEEVLVDKLAPGSFGSLKTLSYSVSDSNQAMRNAPLGMGGEEAVEAVAPLGVVNSRVAIGAGGREAVSSMIMPYFGFNYVYTGDEINLEETSGAVYKRLKNQESTAKDLARTLNSFNFPGLSLKSFDNLQVNNISFSEDKDKGLMISFDLKEGNVYIFENWEKWLIPEREACGSNEACYKQFNIKESDIPTDERAISLANDFITRHNIDISQYGEPIVDNNWREYYASSPDKTNYYFPSQVSVIYPFLIDANPVRDQNGSYTGLRVNIDVLQKRVSGLNGLMVYRFETSDYQLETDSGRIIALAEDGGYSRNFYRGNTDDLPKVELATPEFSYIQMWRYRDNKSEELLIPALIFPVVNKPVEFYYGSNYIAVPLVAELIEELEKEQDNWLLMRQEEGGVEGGNIEIMPLVVPSEEVKELELK